MVFLDCVGSRPQQPTILCGTLMLMLMSAFYVQGNTTPSCPVNFYYTANNKTNCLKCGENSESPSGGERDKCICREDFARAESDKSDFSKPCKAQESSTNWKVIMVAFLVPTASIILISVLFQRFRLERMRKKMNSIKEDEKNGTLQGEKSLKNGVIYANESNSNSISSSVNNLRNNYAADTEERRIVQDSVIKRVMDRQSSGKTDIELRDRKISTISVKKDFVEVYVNIDVYEIPRENVQLERPIGEGCFGFVYKGTVKDLPIEHHSNHVAIKTIKENMIQYDEDFLHELQILRSMTELHKNVIKLLACCTQNGPSLIILEYVEKGDLLSYLKRAVIDTAKEPFRSSIPFIQKLEFCRSIADGMSHLAKQNIIHRDLACRNILLSAELEPKISDFGLSRNKSLDGTYIKGPTMAKLPVMWMAPESIMQGIYSTKSDVWSFGIVLWEIFKNGERPYPGFTSEEVPTVLKSKYRMEKPEECTLVLYNVMRKCWNEDPEDRPSFENLQQLSAWTFSEPIQV